MAQIACSYCGADNASDSPYCNRCQRPLKAAAPRPTVRITNPSAAAAGQATRQPPPPKAPPPRPTTPQSRITQPLSPDLDGPTRVGPPPQFLPSAQPARAPTAQPVRSTSANPGPQRQAPQSPRPQAAPQRPAPQPLTEQDKTQVTPAGLSPLMQRLTPKPQVVSQQATAMLTAEDLAPRKTPPPQARPTAPSPPAAAAPQRRPAPAAPQRPTASISDAETVVRTHPLAAQSLASPPVAVPRLQTPVVPPPQHVATAVAETVILEDVQPPAAPKAPDVHSEATVIASTPLKTQTQAEIAAAQRERAESAPYHGLERPRAGLDVDLDLEPGPSRQSVHLPDDVLHSETMANALSVASRPRLALALAIDAFVVSAVAWGTAATEMLLFDGAWPAERTGLEALAVWVHTYHSTALHAAVLTFAFALGNGAIGAYGGRTLGRALSGLTLVRASGAAPTWLWALWHAASSAVFALLWGAGIFWLVVDSQKRTFGNVASRSVVCTQ